MPKLFSNPVKMVNVLVITAGTLALVGIQAWRQSITTGAPPYGEPESNVPESLDFYDALRYWQRPPGPAKVALQIGHWKNNEVPEELENLRRNTGTHSGEVTEVDVNRWVVEQVASQLEKAGVRVDILPATVPPRYQADVFVAIHADGNTDKSKSGYKIAGPWRDFTGKSEKLVALMNKKYREATGLAFDPNITRNMRGYYAFAWWRYEHAIHPMTVGVIVETGFLTNANDREMLVNRTHVPATAIAESLVEFLQNEGLLEKS